MKKLILFATSLNIGIMTQPAASPKVRLRDKFEIASSQKTERVIVTFKTPQKNICQRLFQSIDPIGYAPAHKMHVYTEGGNKYLQLDLVDGSYIKWDFKTGKYLGNAEKDHSNWPVVVALEEQLLDLDADTYHGTYIKHESNPQLLPVPIEEHAVKLMRPTTLIKWKLIDQAQ